LPIAIGVGAGSEFRRPLGVAVVGGLVVSQVLTLFTIPVTYLYMERISERLGRIGRRPRRQSGRTLDPAGNRPVVINENASE
jgi:AcrB/AcrD/AcrF family